jgi:hypothetical protein
MQSCILPIRVVRIGVHEAGNSTTEVPPPFSARFDFGAMKEGQ